MAATALPVVLQRRAAVTEQAQPLLLPDRLQRAWPALRLPPAQQLQHLLPPRLQQALLPHQLQHPLPPAPHSQRWRNS